MSNGEETRQSMLKYVKQLKRLSAAKAKLKEQARQNELEESEYNIKIDKVYKPFVENLDKKLTPLTADIQNVSNQLIPLKANVENIGKELAPIQTSVDGVKKEIPNLKSGIAQNIELSTNLQLELEDYNAKLRALHNTTQEQLAIESIPEKYYNVIGRTAKLYLANRDKNDSLGISWDEDAEVFKIGRFAVDIDGNSSLIIKDKDRNDQEKVVQNIASSDGLWRLLTQKNPYKVGEPRLKWNQVVTQSDIELYVRLMYYSQACFKGFSKEGRPIKRSSSASKWNELIKPYLESKDKQRSKSTGDEPSGSGLTVLPNDPKSLVHKLFVILGNIKAGHTNVSKEDIQVASEILEIVKPSLSPIAYHNIASAIANYVNS